MIVFDLCCDSGHRFEGWFGSSADYDAQNQRGLIDCPQCGSHAVTKAPMAPAVPRKGNQQPLVPTPTAAEVAVSGAPGGSAGGRPSREAPPSDQALANLPMPPQVAEALQKLAKAQEQALRHSTWVGDSFAAKSRAMHYGDQEVEVIHGRASAKDVHDLLEEGISVAPLPFPVAPPDELN